MLNGWICLMVSSLFHRGDESAVRKEVASVCGDDFRDLRYVRNENLSDCDDYYAFLKCDNVEQYIERLRRSSAVVSIILSGNVPHRFTEKEINEFIGSMEAEKAPGERHKGDIVMVTTGYLKSLYGVVASRARKGHYKVVFSFYMRRFTDNLSVDCLQFVDNVFRHVKFPVSAKDITEGAVSEEALGVISQLAKKHQIHRASCRTSARGGG